METQLVTEDEKFLLNQSIEGSPYWFNSPSELAMIVDTAASPVTFTTVRHISRIRSTGKMIAIQAGFNPTLSRIKISMINPAPGTAADPIDASVAIETIVS